MRLKGGGSVPHEGVTCPDIGIQRIKESRASGIRVSRLYLQGGQNCSGLRVHPREPGGPSDLGGQVGWGDLECSGDQCGQDDQLG